MKCTVCNTVKLTGKQRKYCSKRCKSRSENWIYQNYQAQQKRGRARKQAFVDERGGGCERCGYNRSLSALDFHHKDPSQKRFNLDYRNLSNRTLESCILEFEKCEVLCSNCHREEHEQH